MTTEADRSKEGKPKLIKKEGVIIKGILPIVCIFCKFRTSIEFDLDLHLFENHRIELVRLPIGKGSMDLRTHYAIQEGRRVGICLQSLSKQTREILGFAT